MNQILQNYTFSEAQIIRTVQVSYHISSMNAIDTSSISKGIGLQPSKCWSKGDKFLAKSINTKTRQIESKWCDRAVSVWKIDSVDFMDSKYIEDHLFFLVKKLEPNKDWILHYLLLNKTYKYTVTKEI